MLSWQHHRKRNQLEGGDEVMADNGFFIQDELAAIGATLTIRHMEKDGVAGGSLGKSTKSA